MKIFVFESEDKLYNYAYNMVEKAVEASENATLGLATGSTPLPLYELMIKYFNKGKISYSSVNTFNLDEYVGLVAENKNSYRYFMDSNLFNHIDINKDNTHVPSGLGDLSSQCSKYDNLLNQSTIDLQILGIGNNGHIAFNEPFTSTESTTHIVDLTESTVQANSRLFDRIEDVPQQAITMGLASIMQAKEILLIAIGEKKAQAIADMLSGSDSCPASVLLKHSNVTVLCDKASSSLVMDNEVVKAV